ncbi:MAG: group II intron reverse transcriptase/maturase [Verrucomicrobia bacterium]|nr:group II intron reverse transcriptase/maturase [Verrucomicrobiota bacterium]
MKSSDGVEGRRETESADPISDLFEQALSQDNLQRAWQQVKANGGAPGIDGITIEAFPEWFRPQWPTLRAELLEGTYQPAPVRRVEIDKSDGGKRMLGIPRLLDRLIQQALAQVLGPIFEPVFSDHSYGFRPGRNAHQAVERIREAIKQGYRIAVDLDLAKFFDRVNHDLLMERVARRIKDKRVLRLIGKYLRAGVLVNGRLEATIEGVPQGGPLSPMLANVLLDDLDKELEKRSHRFARYADDFTVMVRSLRAARRVKESITRFLKKKLKLEVNERKSRIVRSDECSFLGFTFRGTKIRWTEKAFEAFKDKLRGLTGRSWGVSMKYRMKKLREYIRGWMGYFGRSEYYRPIPALDEWLRRRMRMCYWKQWRKSRKRISQLIQLGANERYAIQTGLSRKGYWRLSRTLATNSGMTNRWLEEQGLVSIRELWIRIHYPATAR